MATSTLFSRFKKVVFKNREHKPPRVSPVTTNTAESRPEFDDTPVRKRKFRWSRDRKKHDKAQTVPAGHTDDPMAVQHGSLDQDVHDAEGHLEHLDTPVSRSAVQPTADQSFTPVLSSTAEDELLSAVSAIADRDSESVVSSTEDEKFLSAVNFTADEGFVSDESIVFQSGSGTTETAQSINHMAFEERYEVGKKLGSGGFASVYEGIRKTDNLKVALKFARKHSNMKVVSIPDRPKPVPQEVVLALMASLEPACPYIIRMLDWQEFADEYVMVMETPPSCMDLCQYLRLRRKLDESEARYIMWQVVQAANVCCSRGVFHRDIKLENLLINAETQEVKLIDFGVGEFMRDSHYWSFSGTKKYTPPEFLETGVYHAKPTTVYSLGMILFVILHGFFPSEEHLKLVQTDSFPLTFSPECCRLVRACLEPDPERRIPLEQILWHDWLIPVPETLHRKKG